MILNEKEGKEDIMHQLTEQSEHIHLLFPFLHVSV